MYDEDRSALFVAMMIGIWIMTKSATLFARGIGYLIRSAICSIAGRHRLSAEAQDERRP